MFNTIRAKILSITFLMFLLWGIIFIAFFCVIYNDGKDFLIRGRGYVVNMYEKNIMQEVQNIESNALDLALMGDVYSRLQSPESDGSIAQYFVTKIFSNYPDSLGGGIWYQPFKIDPKKKRYCVYAYRDNDGNIITDKSFDKKKYNYLNQNWYKEIIERLSSQTDKVAWSKPYYEKEGANTVMVTAGVGIYNNKNELIGISTVDWNLDEILKTISDMRLTHNSFVVFANRYNGCVYVSTDKFLDNTRLTGKSLDYIPWYNPNMADMSSFIYHDIKYISYVKMLDNGMMLIVNVPEDELIAPMFLHIIYILLGLFGICLLISWIFYIILRDNIASPIDKLIKIANKISRGDLNAEIKIERPEEFVKLAQTFDKMAQDIKNIAKDREKIDSELQIARNIQSSSLPSTFPPFPERKDIDIYAKMTAAKEVGGDFYDFYFIDDDNFMFLVADVSGKGIPAALFMMTTKTLINNMSQFKTSAAELIERANKKICSSNKEGMFVTMLAGIMNVSDGRLTLINCGHNPPLVKRKNGNFEYLELESNMVLGVFPDFKFNVYMTYLKPQEKIFLYTDGATEALNPQEELYGEKRLQEVLNENKDKDVKDLTLALLENINEYSSTMPQADDITMLAFEFKGTVKTYRDKADKKNYSKFNLWLEKNCEDWKLSNELVLKIKLSAEEIYTNIISYAYPENIEDVEALMSCDDKGVVLKFVDWGTPYNPLNTEDPDINQDAKYRKIGGLGIYMVKQSASEVSYENTDGKNILTLKFPFE